MTESRTPYDSLYGVTGDDITQGMSRYLRAQPELVAAVGKEPGTGEIFIFQNNLLKTIEGTSSNALVVTYFGDWATGRGSFESVRMSVEIYCDPLRDSDGNATPGGDREVRLRVKAIERILDPLLNKVGQEEIWMGDVKTVDHTKLGTIAISPVSETDGTLRGQVFYGVSILGYR